MSAARIAELQRMQAARQGKPGFTRNVQAIRAEIARLQSPLRYQLSEPHYV